MQHFLKLAAVQSTRTIGAITRTWLIVLATLWAVLVLLGITDAGVRLHEAIVYGPFASIILSVPVMAVLAVIHVARKW